MNYKKIIIIFSLVVLFVASYAPVFAVSNASIIVTAPSNKVLAGDRIVASVKVRSGGQSINAVSGTLNFSADTLHVVSISKSASIINLWTREPTVLRNKISFEGIVLNPGYAGQNGDVFDIVFEARSSGKASMSVSEGAVLANDGQGTNILGSMGSLAFSILPGQPINEQYAVNTNPVTAVPEHLAALPVITDYSRSILSPESVYIKGKGEPNALTKIAFANASQKSIGEQFIEYLQTKKKRLSDVLVKNANDGSFQYMSSSNLVAGAYNATPFLVDPNKNTEKPGLGVQLLVSDSKVVHYLVVLINVLGLLIPVVGLVVIIYFIPWYSWLRMRILKKKLGLEEEKIEITEHQLKRQDKLLGKHAVDS